MADSGANLCKETTTSRMKTARMKTVTHPILHAQHTTMLIVGLTGGIACGKSTVSSELRRQGFPIIDADLVAKETSCKGHWGYRRIVAAFGTGVLLPDGELDRTALGQLVFSDAAARKKLNQATHLPVAVCLLKKLLGYWLSHCCYVVLDMPLLFETGAHRLVHTTLVVSCSPQVQLQRLMQRDGSTAADAQARIDSQMPLDRKVQLADLVVSNDGGVEELNKQVAVVAGQLHQCSRSWRHWLLSPVGLAAALGGILAALSWYRT